MANPQHLAPESLAELREIAERATPGLEWLADMDSYTLIGKPPGSTFIGHEVKLALCATGDHAARVVRYLAEAQPARALSLLDEVERLREALRPFAEAASSADEESAQDTAAAWESAMAMSVCFGDFRRARDVLKDNPHGD